MKKERLFLLYAFFLALLIAERFLIRVETYNIITSVVGLLAIVPFVSDFKKVQKNNIFSLTMRWENPAKSFWYAVAVPILSVLLVLALEQVIFHLTGHTGWFIDPPRHIYFGNPRKTTVLWVGIQVFLKWASLGLAITLVRTMFLEISFRGYALYACTSWSTPLKGNIRQAISFLVIMGAPPIWGLIISYLNEEMIPGKEWSYLVAGGAMVLYLFLLGFRQGALRLYSQSVVSCIISYWILDFSMNMVNAPSFWPAHLVPFASMFRMCAVQAMACLLSIPMFLRNKKVLQNVLGKPVDEDVNADAIAASVLRQSKQKEES